MQWRPLRLVRKRWKALYIVGGLSVSLLISGAVWQLVSPPVAAILVTVLQAAWVYYGTRIFRGRHEFRDAPRPWWRMTAKPASGFVLAAVFAYILVYSIVGLLRDPASILDWAGVIEYGGLGGLYLYSSVKLWPGRLLGDPGEWVNTPSPAA